MPFFVFVSLSALVCIFLLMLTVQLIKMEKALAETSEIAESMIRKFYGKS